MHRVLRTPELVNLIIDLVHWYSLPAVSRTCVSFFEPAARRLWAKAHTFVNLAMCLPESCWKCSKYVHGLWGYNSKLTIIRDLTTHDVQRFKLYASFVRELEFHPEFAGVRPRSLEKIALALGEANLLPNLRCLKYHGPSQWSRILPFFIPASLTEFTFDIYTVNRGDSEDINPEDGEHERSAIATLSNRRSLDMLELTWPVRFPSLEDTLRGWSSLKHLRLSGSVDAAALCAIVDLPRVESLALINCNVQLPDTVPVNFRIRHSLKTLCVFGTSAPWAAWFFEAAGHVELEQVKLACPNFRRPASLKATCQMLEKHCSKALQILTINEIDPESHGEVVQDEETSTYTIDDLLPLLSFPNLWFCSIELRSRLALWDKDILMIAQAWPALEQLDLYGIAVPRPTCTLTSLLILGHFTPAIRRVAMNMDATTIDALNEALLQSLGDVMAAFTNRSLTTLAVLNSPIDSELAVASFLSRFFLSLKVIYCAIAKDGEREEENRRRRKWAEVAKALPYLKEARAAGMHGPVGTR
ncbi:hypothetical protein K523DRAFT_310976 [Schizophyllum commune Tattone D]|nr:hypothetical protein K523DRAFT_310976 [Schizophyllum commune Tattone D]